jgi:hypothetical protein
MVWNRFGLGEGDLLNTLSYNETTFFVGLNGGIYRSTNNGLNWIVSFQGLTNFDIRSIVQSGSKTLCATYGGGVFVSDDNGELWMPLSSGLTDDRINTLASRGNNLLAGSVSEGILYINLNISSPLWTQINEGLTDTNIVTISIGDDYIFAGSASGKLWRRPVSEIITNIEQSASQVPVNVRLFQNYPNPFNPVTNISFYVPERTEVSLTIFNNLGEEIHNIFSGTVSEGYHSKNWNAETFPSGIYFYRLQADSHSETKRLVLVK